MTKQIYRDIIRDLADANRSGKEVYIDLDGYDDAQGGGYYRIIISFTPSNSDKIAISYQYQTTGTFFPTTLTRIAGGYEDFCHELGMGLMYGDTYDLDQINENGD